MKKIYEFSYYYNAIDIYEVNSIYAYNASCSWIGDIRSSFCTALYSLSLPKSLIYSQCKINFFEEGIEFLFIEKERYFYAYDKIESCYNYDGYIIFLLKEPMIYSTLKIDTPFIMYRNFDKKVLTQIEEILSKRVEHCVIDLDFEQEYRTKRRNEKRKFMKDLINIGLMSLVIGMFIYIVLNEMK